jgi:DNA invertase Pin-like site-specific DNA recombinase
MKELQKLPGNSNNSQERQLLVGGYCRVSRKEQDITIQIKSITEYCLRNGYELYKIGVSGAKDSRPAFDEMRKDMRLMKFNCSMVTKLDRMGRSLKHIVSLFEEFNKLGIHFVATTQHIDTSSSAGKLQMQLMAAFAEFERNLISERTKDGLIGKINVGKRGKDKRPRKKRGVLRKPIFEIKHAWDQ